VKTHSGQNIKTGSLSKKVTVNILFFMSIAISLLGAFYVVYSLIFNISFKVINTDVSGAVFGLVVLYLGIRYIMMVNKLKQDVYGTSSRFTWSNFRPSNFFAKAK
jgi:hypothetical protein